MEKVPTAEEYIKQYPYIDSFLNSAQGYDVLTRFMVDFAKLHVEAALEQVRYNIEINDFDEHGQYSPCVDEPSILNAYPLDNIK